MGIEAVGPILSLISQRLVSAPPQISAPKPTGVAQTQRRYALGLIDEAQMLSELAADGVSPADLNRLRYQAVLQRELDNWTDRLAVITASYDKDLISDAEMQVRVHEFVADAGKAALLIDQLRVAHTPKPQAPKAATVPTLTVAQLMSAWAAQLLTEDQVRTELARRGYAALDIDVLLALQAGKAPVAKPAAAKSLTIAELNAMLPLGLIDPADYLAELVSRGYSPGDAQALLGLQAAKATSALEIGQTVVVKEGVILAVEAFEGTDETMLRAGKLGGAGAVVVKVARQGHDMRYDIPVVGLHTLAVLKKVKAAVLAVEACKTILLEKEKVIETADRQGLALIAVQTEGAGGVNSKFQIPNSKEF